MNRHATALILALAGCTDREPSRLADDSPPVVDGGARDAPDASDSSMPAAEPTELCVGVRDEFATVVPDELEASGLLGRADGCGFELAVFDLPTELLDKGATGWRLNGGDGAGSPEQVLARHGSQVVIAVRPTEEASIDVVELAVDEPSACVTTSFSIQWSELEPGVGANSLEGYTRASKPVGAGRADVCSLVTIEVGGLEHADAHFYPRLKLDPWLKEGRGNVSRAALRGGFSVKLPTALFSVGETYGFSLSGKTRFDGVCYGVSGSVSIAHTGEPQVLEMQLTQGTEMDVTRCPGSVPGSLLDFGVSGTSLYVPVWGTGLDCDFCKDFRPEQ